MPRCFLTFSQIHSKMFLKCFLKINIISTKIQGYFEFYLFVSLLLRHFILFVSIKLIMILFVSPKTHACQIF